MNKKAFVFTMDAALALIPIFIVMASVSQVSTGGSLLLQSSWLGEERIAQDTLRVMEIKGLIKSTNETELDDFLNKTIPSYLNYNYTIMNVTTGEEIISVTRGDISNATDVIQASRIVSVGVNPRYAVLTPTALTKTLIDITDPRKDNQSMALDVVISALLGVPVNVSIGSYPVIDDPGIWYQMGQVKVSISTLESWYTANQTIGYLLDKLYDEAVLEGNTDARDGFAEIRSRVSSAGRGWLPYDINDILDYDPSIPSVEDMEISAIEILYTASQSANKIDSEEHTIAVYNSTEDGRLDITLDLTGNETTKTIINKSANPPFYSESTTKTEIEVYRNETGDPSWKLKETIRAYINPEASFSLTNVLLDPTDASIVLVDIKSGTNGKFVATTATSGGRISADEVEVTLSPKRYTGDPMVESGVIFRYNSSNSMGVDFYNDYKNATIYAGSELSQILNEFPLTTLEFNATTGYVLAEREGYVTVSSIKFEVPQYLVQLKLWGS